MNIQNPASNQTNFMKKTKTLTYRIPFQTLYTLQHIHIHISQGFEYSYVEIIRDGKYMKARELFLKYMQQLLWQIWQAIGWNGISAIAAFIVAIDVLHKPRREPPAFPPQSQLFYTKHPKKRNRHRSRNRKRMCQ